MAKVLVVDDDSHFRGIIERIILRSYTYSVKSVASEEEAWDDLSKSAYDLVMLDLHIDGKKSWDTLKRIKALPSSPVVIMISCEDLPENAAYARALGAADFVPKPIDFGRLKSSVDAALERRIDSPLGRRAGDAAGAGGDGVALGLLLLADRESRAETVGALSPSRFRLFRTDDPGAAAETVRKERLDAVLARMDKDAGPAALLLGMLKEEEAGRLRVPVIAVTDADPERILSALKAGADDYLSFPFDPRILAAKVEAHARSRREQERKLEQLAAKAVTDAVTGLYTPAHFKARLDEEVCRSLRYRRDLALALLKMEERPDASGPEARDRMLAEVSGVLRAALRNSDVVGRWGEYQFALILPEATAERVAHRADTIRAQVEQRIAELKVGTDEVACRVGLASLPRDEGNGVAPRIPLDPDGLLGMANAALARAQHSSRGGVEVFEGADG